MHLGNIELKKLIPISSATALALFAAVGIFNVVVPTPPSDAYAATPSDAPEMDKAKRILGTKCIMCHSKSPELPFYAQLPIAGSFINKHVKEGSGMMDLQELLAGTSKDKWAYDRLEHVVTNSTMPINSYLLLHWNGKLTSQEQDDIVAWIKQRRADNP